MLEIAIEETEFFNEKSMKLIRVPSVTLRLEHSLRSLSKWETFWEIPFYSDKKKTPEQLLSYVSQMSEDPIDDFTLSRFGKDEFDKLNKYLGSKLSATWFSDEGDEKPGRGPIVTSELIYYWMTAFNIPFECDTWPLPRLMNLIKIAQIKAEQQNPNKKNRRPKSQMLSERAALNAKRRADMNSKG